MNDYATKAIGDGFKSCDVCDTNLRIVSTMTMLLPETFPSLHLKSDHLVTLNMIQDLSLDHSLHIFSSGEIITMGKKDFRKLDLVTGITRNTGNIQSLILLDLE